ncbi:MAG: hypothetical protein HY865_18680 [Chloroflexi bacterium]|nr:hypothetical protein [Chloroflexota bacterium]
MSTATMSNSYSPVTYRLAGFFQKLVVALLFVACIAGSMALFSVYQKNVSSYWMMVLAILSVGLASGSVSRMVFYQWAGFVRFVAILLILPVGMFVLGLFTNWRIGIGPLNPWVRGSIPQDELTQLGGAFLVALISLEAWWKHHPKTEDAPSNVRPASNGRRERTPSTASMQPAQPRPSQTETQESLVFLPRGTSRPKVVKAARVRSRKVSAADKLVLKHTEPSARSRNKRLFGRKPKLQISTFEEHRCPYCLDEVKRNDPRGVKECDICHSLHHADCWAITGNCQVPHLN